MEDEDVKFLSQLGGWMSRHLPVIVTITVLAAGLVGHASIALYQISDLRAENTSLHMILDQSQPIETRKRVEKLESDWKLLLENQASMRTDLQVVRTILERIEKGM